MFLEDFYCINKSLLFLFAIPRGLSIILIIAISENICFTLERDNTNIVGTFI